MLMADPRAWLSSNETAADLLDRLERERPSLILPPLHRVPICAGNVVEITGPSPSAKSEILLQAAIHCILPKQWRGMHFGGLERNVAYVDLDCRFDVLRLAQVLKLRIFSSFGSVDSSCWDLNKLYTESSIMLSQDDHLYNELFLSCMKRFFYIRCYNSYEFLAALQTIRPGFKSSKKEGPSASLYILIIDSIGAFHWNDRACQPLQKNDSERRKLSIEDMTERVVLEINKIRELQPLLVLASKATIFAFANPVNLKNSNVSHNQSSVGLGRMKKEGEANLLYREYMAPVWQSFVTHRVQLGISDVILSAVKNEKRHAYVCKWIQPQISITEQFVVENSGIVMLS